jgi:hypothetical protein
MPGLTRRQLCAGTALAGAAWVGGCVPAGSSGPRERTLATFSELVGTAFTVDTGPGPQPLTLAAVRLHGPPIRSPRPRGESFTLIFQAPQAMSLAQGTRQVTHPELGTFSMFLVPAMAPGGTTFTASYCRL